jgi:hypothetical protein
LLASYSDGRINLSEIKLSAFEHTAVEMIFKVLLLIFINILPQRLPDRCRKREGAACNYCQHWQNSATCLTHKNPGTALHAKWTCRPALVSELQLHIRGNREYTAWKWLAPPSNASFRGICTAAAPKPDVPRHFLTGCFGQMSSIYVQVQRMDVTLLRLPTQCHKWAV